MKRLLSSNILLNVGVALAGVLLVGGIAAFVSSRPDPPATNTTTYSPDYEPPVTTPPTYTAADLPKGVREIAGAFILSAAGREDLPKAWKLAHPELRTQCGCTYKEWLTGNIPVQYYPTKDISTASFEISSVEPREIFLRILVLPKETATVKPQVFDIGLKALGSGQEKTWRVNYWAARVSIPVPAAPEG